MKFNLLLLMTVLFSGVGMSHAAAEKPLNIAHRGACAYLPEHTLPAKALAYGMNADYIEQDVVLTKDDVPLIIHDIHLDTVTDVAEKFPQRARADGRFYAIDFTFAEIRSLKVSERFDLETRKAVFPGRFPLWKSSFALHSLQEEIEMIQGLNKATGKNTGIYPEIKEPAWHREQGKDISSVVLRILAEYGYKKSSDDIFLQCFDAAELKRIRKELKCELKLIQLIEEDCDLQAVAEYADGIGPAISQLIAAPSPEGRLVPGELWKWAKKLKLKIHPYTFRIDALPQGISGEKLLAFLCKDAEIDGIFSDFPDVSGNYIDKNY
jgi:glycerophosphoryl diester phosphodiesterase